jgi:ribonuclease BN (tRNA processing enzyme)
MWERAFDVNEFTEAEAFETVGFTVAAVRLPHYTMKAFGFRVRNGDKTLAYSGDSAPTDELRALAKGADLFVCEATLADGTTDGELRGHLTAEEALAVADGPVLLTHRPVELAAPAEVEIAYDGLVKHI